MESSIAVIGLGFIIAWLGVVMIFMSLRADPAELERRHLGFLAKPFAKANASRRIIKLFIIVGILVTGFLYVASWMGWLPW